MKTAPKISAYRYKHQLKGENTKCHSLQNVDRCLTFQKNNSFFFQNLYSFFGNSFLSSQSTKYQTFLFIIYVLSKILEFTCSVSLLIPPAFKTGLLKELRGSQEDQNYSPKCVFLNPYRALKGMKSYKQSLDIYIYAYILFE